MSTIAKSVRRPRATDYSRSMWKKRLYTRDEVLRILGNEVTLRAREDAGLLTPLDPTLLAGAGITFYSDIQVRQFTGRNRIVEEVVCNWITGHKPVVVRTPYWKWKQR